MGDSFEAARSGLATLRGDGLGLLLGRRGPRLGREPDRSRRAGPGRRDRARGAGGLGEPGPGAAPPQRPRSVREGDGRGPQARPRQRSRRAPFGTPRGAPRRLRQGRDAPETGDRSGPESPPVPLRSRQGIRAPGAGRGRGPPAAGGDRGAGPEQPRRADRPGPPGGQVGRRRVAPGGDPGPERPVGLLAREGPRAVRVRGEGHRREEPEARHVTRAGPPQPARDRPRLPPGERRPGTPGRHRGRADPPVPAHAEPLSNSRAAGSVGRVRLQSPGQGRGEEGGRRLPAHRPQGWCGDAPRSRRPRASQGRRLGHHRPVPRRGGRETADAPRRRRGRLEFGLSARPRPRRRRGCPVPEAGGGRLVHRRDRRHEAGAGDPRDERLGHLGRGHRDGRRSRLRGRRA